MILKLCLCIACSSRLALCALRVALLRTSVKILCWFGVHPLVLAAHTLVTTESHPQIVCLSEAPSCHCGAIVFRERLLAAHQCRKHAMWPVVVRYAGQPSACLIRLTQCPFRQLLCGHPRRSGIWFLNSVLRFLPISTQVVELAIQCELIYEACRVCAGSRAHMAIFFGLRLLGPLRSAIGQQGDLIVFYHRSLPRGPGRQCRAPHEFAVGETINDIRAGQEIITHISWIPDPLGVNS